ncbi:hypothetical protein [Inquilinus limosus]|uniref:Uncharacterized protein n=1 Tax=Inquilinus limosus TaxID=171674 RepID=A0A211ZQ71_9PROT|nr:hypothetical protein [Inquilinus limosus]OWJ67423.1 hypothetical protein BWR60_09460 [Inquilinus limosus]
MTAAPQKLPGAGYRRTPDSATRIVVSFDRDTFEQIRQRAERERTSFAEQVRTLVEWGLEDCEG